MRRIVSLLVVAGLTAGAVLAAAAPSGASVGAKTSRFCKELKSVDTGNIGNPTTKKGARKTLKSLRTLERAAKGKTKQAMHQIVDAYEHVADGDSPREVFTDGDLIRALGTFALAAGKCLASDLPDLPDISLPDISLPDISLPGR
jgi:hypothetical protein